MGPMAKEETDVQSRMHSNENMETEDLIIPEAGIRRISLISRHVVAIRRLVTYSLGKSSSLTKPIISDVHIYQPGLSSSPDEPGIQSYIRFTAPRF